jgi:hypothetical protein
MANDIETPVQTNLNEPVAVKASDKPEIAARPSFLKDVKNGLVHVARTIWQVPAARGYIATLFVRFGLPAGLAAIIVPIVDALVK